MSEEREKIKYLVADTTAFINAVPLNDYAVNVLTVPDVVAEVRNKRQIRRLCVLPYDLQVREPRTESIKHCVEFSKKTGDYASLSGIDLKVIALTYELESDLMGTEHLRKDPIISTIIASKEKPVELQNNTQLPGWYDDDDSLSSDDGEEDEDNNTNEDNDNDADTNENDSIKDAIERSLENFDSTQQASPDINTEKELENLFEKLMCEASDNDNTICDYLLPQTKQDSDDDNDGEQNCNDLKQPNPDEVSSQVGNDDNDEHGDWITPKNIAKVKKSMEGKIEDEIIPQVACMSTDFAIQNTLKQMNLNIAALNGRVIKHLRTYILRCYACFKTTSIMTKIFCPNCGNKTLKRVAVSLDENGKQVIHINTRRPLTSKYKNQSLPRFRGGKHSHNPILFEDQPMPRQMPSRVAKTKTNALDEDYIAGFSPFAMRDVDSKSAMLRSKGHVKEWTRNTKYEEDRRRKFYNRLYK